MSLAEYMLQASSEVFALDALADNISIYTTNCCLEKKIHLNTVKERRDTMIIDFAWSGQTTASKHFIEL